MRVCVFLPSFGLLCCGGTHREFTCQIYINKLNSVLLFCFFFAEDISGLITTLSLSLIFGLSYSMVWILNYLVFDIWEHDDVGVLKSNANKMVRQSDCKQANLAQIFNHFFCR